jgi:hypothetical protein
MKELLAKHHACSEARIWIGERTFEQAYNECPRGDWLLWLFDKTNPDDIKRFTLAKGHCANTVRQLMKDPRSIKAVDTAIAFGEGKATREELNAASAAAASASYYDYASYFDYAAAAASAAAASAAAAASYSDYVAADAKSAKKENQKLTADICRIYLSIEIWNVR